MVVDVAHRKPQQKSSKSPDSRIIAVTEGCWFGPWGRKLTLTKHVCCGKRALLVRRGREHLSEDPEVAGHQPKKTKLEGFRKREEIKSKKGPGMEGERDPPTHRGEPAQRTKGEALGNKNLGGMPSSFICALKRRAAVLKD